jgi:hypothetical protein
MKVKQNADVTAVQGDAMKKRKLDVGKEPICSMCLDPLSDRIAEALTPCGHTFHADCIDAWTRSSGMGRERCCPFRCYRSAIANDRQQATGPEASAFSQAIAAINAAFATPVVPQPRPDTAEQDAADDAHDRALEAELADDANLPGTGSSN